MKKNIFLILFAMMSSAYTANAQSCCSSEAKDKSSCTKKATSKVASTSEAKAVLVSNLHNNDEKTEKFTVYGNCGMCERTIENALKDVDGVSKGDWDRETDVMTVVYNL